MQLEYQAFGKIYGTQGTKGKTGASLPPSRSKPEYDWSRARYSAAETEGTLCKQPPEHEGDCEPEAIRETRKEIKRKVAYRVGMPLGIDDQGRDRGEDIPGDITQECFLKALEKRTREGGRGCLCRLAGHKKAIQWAISHHARHETVQQRYEGTYAIERHGKPAQQFDVITENGLETSTESGSSEPVVIDWTTPEALALEHEEQAHQWALIQEAVKRSKRKYTRAVVAFILHPDEMPKVNAQRKNQELDALRKAVEEIDAENRKISLNTKKTRTI
jgi:hypothetical protein